MAERVRSGPFARACSGTSGPCGRDGAVQVHRQPQLVSDLLRGYSGPAPAGAAAGPAQARESWEFRPELIAGAEGRLDALFSAAGPPRDPSAAAEDAVTDRLLDDLDVRGALDIAVTEGGDVARSLVRVLSLG